MASAASHEEMTAPLELEGELELGFNAERLALVTSGNTAVLKLPSVGCGWRIYRSLRGAQPDARLVSVIRALNAADLRVKVATGSRMLVSAGAGSKPSRLSSKFGLPPVKVHWGGLIRSVLRL